MTEILEGKCEIRPSVDLLPTVFCSRDWQDVAIYKVVTEVGAVGGSMHAGTPEYYIK